MTIRFLIYGLIGWCTEVFWTGLGSFIRGDAKLRGWTYLWMFPIYGLAIMIEPIHNYIREWPLLIRGGIYVIIIFGIEYITGWLLQNTIKVCPWDYSSSPYSLDGFIRLDYAPVWFVLGLLFERLHDLLLRLKI